jgi:hypothetical protein
MGAVAYAGLRTVLLAADRHLFAQAGLLAAVVLASAAVYFGLARLLRCEELSEFFLLLRRGEPQADVVAQGGAQ